MRELPNLITYPDCFSEELAVGGGAYTYAYLDNTVLTPSGKPSIRMNVDTVRGSREVDINFNPNWVVGNIKPNDRLIFKCLAKTNINGGQNQPNTVYTGTRVGIDLLNIQGSQIKIIDGVPHWYEQINNQWVSQGRISATETYDFWGIIPVSQFLLPYGRDWALIYQDIIIPDYTYTHDLSNGFPQITPCKINAFAAWVQGMEINTPAPQYFGDAELYINPTNPISLPFHDSFINPALPNWNKINGSWNVQ